MIEGLYAQPKPQETTFQEVEQENGQGAPGRCPGQAVDGDQKIVGREGNHSQQQNRNQIEAIIGRIQDDLRIDPVGHVKPSGQSNP